MTNNKRHDSTRTSESRATSIERRAIRATKYAPTNKVYGFGA